MGHVMSHGSRDVMWCHVGHLVPCGSRVTWWLMSFGSRDDIWVAWCHVGHLVPCGLRSTTWVTWCHVGNVMLFDLFCVPSEIFGSRNFHNLFSKSYYIWLKVQHHVIWHTRCYKNLLQVTCADCYKIKEPWKLNDARTLNITPFVISFATSVKTKIDVALSLIACSKVRHFFCYNRGLNSLKSRSRS